MPVHNVEIAAALARLADLLEIEGANPFRVRAYRNAARLVETLPRSVADMVAAGEDVSGLPGIGAALAAKLKDMVATGRLEALEKEQQRVPATLSDLMAIPGIGPRRVRAIYERLKISDRVALEQAARDGRLRKLEGFGEKIEAKILDHLQRQGPSGRRLLLMTAEQLVESLLAAVRGAPGVRQVTVAGSFRRRLETVGDVDLLAVAADSAEPMRRFAEHEDVARVLARGATRSAVVLRAGLQVDLRVVPESAYGAALHYFTGSKAHNIAVRARGVKAGLKINEYGVFRGEQRLGGATEAEVFGAVGLPFIEPELRENQGEIEAAERGALPRLVTLADLRGDLQAHTDATDGRDALETMAEAARARGYAYLAITDHSKRMTVARGLNATRLKQQGREIDRLNDRQHGFRLLKAVEVDILEDGGLDLSDDVLKDLDLVVAAVHHRFTLSREQQTERIVRALDNPCVHILAHPTGRLIGERDPYDLDLERVLRAAAERGCAVELNAHPTRLDLTDAGCRLARELGVKVAISTDAHSASDLALMRFGVGQARRGWLGADDVLNTRPWEAARALLRRA